MSHQVRFSVGDRVDHVFADERAGVDGRVMAVLNYGKVLTIQWSDGVTGNHEARYVTPHVETEGS